MRESFRRHQPGRQRARITTSTAIEGYTGLSRATQGYSRHYVSAVRFIGYCLPYNNGNALMTSIQLPVTMRAQPTITVVDAAGNAGKITSVAVNGNAVNNVTPPAGLDVDTKTWSFASGGYGGSIPGIMWGYYTATAEI